VAAAFQLAVTRMPARSPSSSADTPVISAASGCGPASPNLPIFTRTWGNLSRRFGALTALGVAIALGLSLVFEWFV